MELKQMLIIGGIALFLIILITIIVTLSFARWIFIPTTTPLSTSPTSAPTILTPTPISPTPAGQSSPLEGTPTLQSYTGTIVRIASQPVQYKNAIIVTIQTSTSQVPLYITPATVITTATGQQLARNQLQTGMMLTANGTATEGGIDVNSLTIQ